MQISDTKLKLERYKLIQNLPNLDKKDSEFFPLLSNETPAKLQNKLRGQITMSKVNRYLKFSVRQRKDGVIVKRVGE